MTEKDDVIKEFTSLKGVGKKKAELLYDKGLNSMDKLKKASIKDLTAVEGVNEKLAKELLDQIKKTEPKKETKKPSKETKKKEEKTKPEVKKKKTAEKKTKKPESRIKKETEEEKEIPEEEKKEEVYKVKKKPKISKEKKERIKIRKQIKNRRPEFLREEWFRYKRIPENWRRPDGISSKMRINKKYRPSKVRVGFRGPKDVRGLHSSGFKEVMVFNVNDLEQVNPETQAARIGGSVGTKKRLEIEKKAEELDIRILNM